ncbi:MAG: hypothetical protein HUJ68_13955 [Clostridia bacterium]|nr:hypothetical protein [Clostridia bacterium]
MFYTIIDWLYFTLIVKKYRHYIVEKGNFENLFLEENSLFRVPIFHLINTVVVYFLLNKIEISKKPDIFISYVIVDAISQLKFIINKCKIYYKFLRKQKNAF